MSGDWYYAKDGSFGGPETAARLLELLSLGRIEATTPIWRDGAADWEPLHSALNIVSPSPLAQDLQSATYSQNSLRRAALGESTNEQKPAPAPAPTTKRKFRNWLLWWRIDQTELDRQVLQYDDLGFIHTARGVAVACVAFSGILTAVFAYFGVMGLDRMAYVDVALFGGLALFIYFGHRWASLLAMVLWTIEKVVFVVQGAEAAHPNSGMAIGQVMWWAAYMHAFYFAFRVEQRRKARLSTVIVPA